MPGHWDKGPSVYPKRSPPLFQMTNGERRHCTTKEVVS
jgi:hypothetical protein